MTAERKRETRERFLLGGIVVRAGLSDADRAFLLGGLLELAAVASGSAEHQRLKAKGGMAFQRDRLKSVEAGDAGLAVSDDSEKTNGD